MGTCPALSGGVNFYDVLADGYHTPLTKTQIAELFHAGRLGRNHPCKLAERRDWRTIDELFPLLKYDSATSPSPSNDLIQRRDPTLYAIAGAFVIIAITVLGLFLWKPTAAPTVQRIVESTQRFSESRAVFSTPSVSSRLETTARHGSNSNTDRRAEEARRREQTAREQAAAANQSRAIAERQRQEAQKAAGTDYQVPLDQNYYVPMNGGGVSVKIHDNDVTSFDVWVNGGVRHEVPKQKGITHSGTDETLIYYNGRASLYYVWEISGKLNHCLLRVRDN